MLSKNHDRLTARDHIFFTMNPVIIYCRVCSENLSTGAQLFVTICLTMLNAMNFSSLLWDERLTFEKYIKES